MSTLSGAFEQFKDIDSIPTNDILSWLKNNPNIYRIENYIANLILYPQTIPDSEEELDIELAIIREVLKRNPQYYNPKTKKIIIPEELITRFTDLVKLAWAFVDGYKPVGVNEIILTKKNYPLVLGTVITPVFKKPTGGMMDFLFDKNPNPTAQRIYSIRQESLMVVPCLLPKVKVTFTSKDALLFDEDEMVFDVAGGQVGVIVDGRQKQ